MNLTRREIAALLEVGWAFQSLRIKAARDFLSRNGQTYSGQDARITLENIGTAIPKLAEAERV
jgi:hypothetical protein